MPRYQVNPISFESMGLRPPLLFVGPDAQYAAVFACGEHVAVLESEDGRRITAGPVRRTALRDPYNTVAQAFLARGYVRREVVSQDLASFVTQFMQLAGFTLDHLESAFELCAR